MYYQDSFEIWKDFDQKRALELRYQKLHLTLISINKKLNMYIYKEFWRNLKSHVEYVMDEEMRKEEEEIIFKEQ